MAEAKWELEQQIEVLEKQAEKEESDLFGDPGVRLVKALEKNIAILTILKKLDTIPTSLERWYAQERNKKSNHGS